MKIACVSTSQVPSSTANSIQVMKVCQALAQLGHEVKLWVPGKLPATTEEIPTQYGLTTTFEIEWLPASARFKRYDFSWQSVRKAQKWGAEVFYTWTPQAALLAKMRGMQTVLEMHDRATGNLGPWILKQYLLRPQKCLLVCITNALRRALEEQLHLTISDRKVVIAPNGVDLDRYADLPTPGNARKALGYSERMTVSYTGHFYEGRGMEVLFHLAKTFPEIQFLWVGGREKELTAVRERLSRDQIQNVILTGFVDNRTLPMYQAASEILLMPYELTIAGSSGGNSADICSPMKMFEYMAAGRIILTSDLPVIREVLDEESAYFCPPEDKEAWAMILAEVIADPESQQKAVQARNKSSRYGILAREEKILKGLSGS